MIGFRNFAGLLAVVLAFGSNSVWAHAQEGSLHKIEIVRLDPRFDKLVPLGVRIDKIAGGHKWVEGPVWNRKEEYLLFSDIPNNSIYKWREARGESLFLKPSGYTGKAPFRGAEPGSNGLTFDPAGRLVLAEHGDRRIARLEKNGRKTTLVDRYEGKRINSPNDLVFKSNGDLYFTDPPFGLPKAFDDPRKELPFQGVYKFSKDGKLTLSQRISRPPMASRSPRTRKNSTSATPTPAMPSGWSMT
jgi:gluconolactonase